MPKDHLKGVLRIKPMTKARARELLKVDNDRQLAMKLGITHPSVCNWGRMVPVARIGQINRIVQGIEQ